MDQSLTTHMQHFITVSLAEVMMASVRDGPPTGEAVAVVLYSFAMGCDLYCPLLCLRATEVQ